MTLKENLGTLIEEYGFTPTNKFLNLLEKAFYGVTSYNKTGIAIVETQNHVAWQNLSLMTEGRQLYEEKMTCVADLFYFNEVPHNLTIEIHDSSYQKRMEELATIFSRHINEGGKVRCYIKEKKPKSLVLKVFEGDTPSGWRLGEDL
jgi:hypothetical protein